MNRLAAFLQIQLRGVARVLADALFPALREARAENQRLAAELEHARQAARQAEGERDKTARLLRTLMESIPEYMYVKDRQSRFLMNSAAHASAMGWQQEAIVGKTDFDLFPYNMAVHYFADEQSIMRSGRVLINKEERSVRGDGRPIWVLSSKAPVFDETGEIVGLVGVTRDITELKERERRLEESERFIQQVTATAPDVIYVLDLATDTYKYTNFEALQRLLGYSNRELMEMRHVWLTQLAHPDDLHLLDDWNRWFRDARDDEVYEFIIRVRHKNGEWRWFSARDRVFARDADGYPTQAIGVAQDITERLQAERALRRHNEYLKALSEIAPALMNRLDADDLLQTLIERAKLLMRTEAAFIDLLRTGGEMGDFLSAGRFAAYHTSVAMGQGLVGRVWQTGEAVVVDDYACWPHALRSRVNSGVRAVLGVPIKSEGKVVGVLGVWHSEAGRRFEPFEVDLLNQIGELVSIALDNARLYAQSRHELEERRRIEAELRAERDFIATVLSTASAMISVVDRNGYFVSINRATERLTGYDNDELVGRRVWEAVIPPEDIPGVQRALATLVAGNFPNNHTNHWRLKDGSKRLIEWSNNALLDDNGEVALVVSSGIDITERRQLEESNLQLALEREKVKMLGTFMRDASHDFRTPLSILNTNLYLIRRLHPFEAIESRLTEMERQVNHLTRLIDQLLVMTRLDSAPEMSYAPVDVNRLVEDLGGSFSTTAAASGIEITLALDANLPCPTADALKLSEAISHLFANALQYTGAGGTISIRTYFADGSVWIEVQDTGIGIAPDDLPHIFERFYRADKARSSAAGGVGLGLAIAAKIVELHQGTITAGSRVSEGSTFTIGLPLAPSAIV